MSPSGRWLRCPSSLSLLPRAPARSRLLVALAGSAAGPAGPAGRAVQPAVRDRDRDGRAAGRVRNCSPLPGNGPLAAAAGAQGARMPSAQAGQDLRRPVREDDPAGRAWPITTWPMTCCAGGRRAGRRVRSAASPAKVQERRRDKARKARARARKAARRERGARELSGKQARKAGGGAEGRRGRGRGQRAGLSPAAARSSRRLGLRPRPGSCWAPGAARCGLRRPPPRPRAAAWAPTAKRPKVKGQEAPQHLGFFWHGSRLSAAQRGVDRKTNETTVIGPVIDEMDLAGVCLTVDALHSLAGLDQRCWPAAATSSS